jgi:hypothetical protein
MQTLQADCGCGYLQLKVDGNAVAAGERRASTGTHWHEIRLEKRERLARSQSCSALLHTCRRNHLTEQNTLTAAGHMTA